MVTACAHSLLGPERARSVLRHSDQPAVFGMLWWVHIPHGWWPACAASLPFLQAEKERMKKEKAKQFHAAASQVRGVKLEAACMALRC